MRIKNGNWIDLWTQIEHKGFELFRCFISKHTNCFIWNWFPEIDSQMHHNLIIINKFFHFWIDIHFSQVFIRRFLCKKHKNIIIYSFIKSVQFAFEEKIPHRIERSQLTMKYKFETRVWYCLYTHDSSTLIHENGKWLLNQFLLPNIFLLNNNFVIDCCFSCGHSLWNIFRL